MREHVNERFLAFSYGEENASVFAMKRGNFVSKCCRPNRVYGECYFIAVHLWSIGYALLVRSRPSTHRLAFARENLVLLLFSLVTLLTSVELHHCRLQ